VTDSDPLEVSIHIAAAPDVVYRYFTDPERYRQWMGDVVRLDAVPGGVFRVGMRDGVAAEGTFVELDAPRRLLFTWGWTDLFEVAPGSTRVEVTLTEEDGGTRVDVRHHDLPTDEAREQHRGGWEMYLGRLAVRAAGGDPGTDPNL
jgi:uncharacterized protein YndB with AHSA1/START domain